MDLLSSYGYAFLILCKFMYLHNIIYIYKIQRRRVPLPPTYGIPSYATTHYIMGVDSQKIAPPSPPGCGYGFGLISSSPCGVDMVLGSLPP